MTFGLYCSVSTVVGQLVAPFGQHDVNYLGILLNLAGMTGATVFALAQTKFHFSYLKANKVIAFMTLLMLCTLGLVIQNKLYAQIAFALFGFFNVPIIFVAYELAVD